MKRTNKEYLLLVLSIFAGVAISLFAILRLSNQEWLVGLFDVIVGVGMASIAYHVYTTQKVAFPSIVLAMLSCAAAVATVYVKGVENIYWTYPAVVAAYYLLSPKRAIYLTVIMLALLAPQMYQYLSLFSFLSSITTILMTCLFGYFFSTSVLEQHQMLSELAVTDALTGAGNRRALDHKLVEIVSAQSRNPSTVSLLLLDLDNFKRVNDDFGHLVGDQILIRISEIIEGRIRVTDTLYRFGGEEFVIVPLELDLDMAFQLAEQLRILVENYDLVTERKVTISVGVAQYKQGETSESWLNRADEALYRAKNGGRNLVCAAKDEV
ncbi:MAG: GGDEF domain-containing protein [Kangiellaceae bacterium]|nr:GGDEF domain-containing protein [Kangiellaceae bacterium]